MSTVWTSAAVHFMAAKMNQTNDTFYLAALQIVENHQSFIFLSQADSFRSKVFYSLPIGQFCTFRDYIFLCYISIDHVISFLNLFNKKIKMHNLLI